jgi:hypothetical protein
MDGGKRKPKDVSTNLASEAEVVRGKDEVCFAGLCGSSMLIWVKAELRGLGSLLFEDGSNNSC